MRNYKYSFGLLLGIALGILGGGAMAEEIRLPLHKLMVTNKPLRMGGQNGSAKLDIPLGIRTNLKQARLHLVYSNSQSLDRTRSSLMVSLNGSMLKQYVLEPSQSQSEVDITLPVQNFTPGYNALAFSVVQHYPEPGQYEDRLAPELWTEIDSSKSYVTFDTELRVIQPVLSDLEQYFDPKADNKWKVSLLHPQGIKLDAKHLEWMNLGVQGVASRLQYAPTSVRLSDVKPGGSGDVRVDVSSLADADSILIGTLEELKPFLSDDVVAKVAGAFLGIYHLSSNSGRVVVVISGRNDDEVRRAATAFSYATTSLPDQQSIVISKFVEPEWKPYSAMGKLHYGEKYTFSRLGVATQTVKGFYASEMPLSFSVPADMFANENNAVKLLLHLSYGAGFRSDSVINVMINGHFVTAIYLNAPQGAELRNYEVRLPVRSLMPGKNVVQIQPLLTPSVTLSQDRNLAVTLFGDSVLEMPKAEHYAQLPDLSLMSSTGFPYTREPNGRDVQVWLSNPDIYSVSAAMTLLAHIAQQTGLPMTGVSFAANTPPDASKNLIVVGEQSNLPPEINAKSPWKFEKDGMTVTDASKLVQPSPSAVVGIGEVGNGLDVKEGNTDLASSTIKYDGTLGDTALLMQFESPFHNGNTAIVLTAATGALLAERTESLITPEFWTKLNGDVFTWQATDKSAFSQMVGASYHIGEIGTITRLDYYFGKYPWLLISVSLILLLAFVVVSIRLLKSYRNRHAAELSTK